MASAVEEAARRRIQAPRRSGDCVLAPAPAEWESLWQQNVRQGMSYPQPLAAWRKEARREVYQAALKFTREFRDVNRLGAQSDRLILTGHQPNLFHPGVWFKNFVLSYLGQRFSAGAIQLVIDNDLYRYSSIRVPAGSFESPRVEHLSFDRVTQAVPFEIATLTDESLFRSFGERVWQTIRPFIADPIIRQFWPRVLREQRRTSNVGQALADARQAIEAENGLESLELPLSTICKTNLFRRFVAHCVARGNEFAEIHNRCLAEFRSRRKLRSPSQPVPDLDVSATEVETPFWVWSASAPVRRRLYVRRSGGTMVLSDHDRWECQSDNEDQLMQRMGQLENDGIAIRPRALMTTMYARMVLSDLFVHGIGGAVYDIVTDEIVRRFFLVEPPRFLTTTATIHLPITAADVSESDLVRLDTESRELKFHPEKHLTAVDRAAIELVDAKRAWIERTGMDVNLKDRHEAIGDLNRRLFSLLDDRVTDLGERRSRMVDEVQRSKILASREYSFVLFPNSLIGQLQSLASGAK